MFGKVFRGKNWKLASEKKWEEEDIRSDHLKEKVGVTSFEETEYEVFEIEGGFAAFPVSRDELPPQSRFVVNACGGNVIRCVAAKEESEARERLQQICSDWKTAGVLYLWKENSMEKICTFDGHNIKQA